MIQKKLSRQLKWRYLLWLLTICVVTVTPVALALYYQHTVAMPTIWPLPTDASQARKARMINLLYPVIHQQNKQLLSQRQHLLSLMERKGQFPQTSLSWLKSLSRQYQLAWPASGIPSRWLHKLLARVDIIPADLALAQAATESAWGESRFALRGNNYYGIWCFTPGCGLIPRQRPAGATYEVQSFNNISANVAAYMHNLNTHQSYHHFRQLRARLRAQHQPLTGLSLSGGLEKYSGIGQAYVAQLKRLIRHNNLTCFDHPHPPDCYGQGSRH